MVPYEIVLAAGCVLGWCSAGLGINIVIMLYILYCPTVQYKIVSTCGCILDGCITELGGNVVVLLWIVCCGICYNYVNMAIQLYYYIGVRLRVAFVDEIP